MCGIVGYVGRKNPIPVIIDGLRTLEYRGYDSAGIAFWDKNEINVVKTIGRVDILGKLVDGKKADSLVAMGHTRWATHGEPSNANAHPHFDCSKEVFVVHNGVIENFHELKGALGRSGHKFSSETDTEVIAHLIEENLKNGVSLEEAVLDVLPKIKGTYGLAIMSKRNPQKLIAVRNFSPLVLGVGDGEYVVASDAAPILRHTRQLIYIDDGEMVTITPDSYSILNIKREVVEKIPEESKWTVESAQKGGYPHFTLKEIMEQPESLRNSLRGRLVVEEGNAQLGGLTEVKDKLRNINRLLILGCGTAYLAGLTGRYMLEEYTGLKTEVDLASEFRYRKSIIDDKTAVIGVSQSGETADTIAAMKEAKEKGALTLGIVNAVGSTLARITDAGVYNHAGPEIGVASTKAFSSQLAILCLYTLFLGRQRNVSVTMGERIAKELANIPDLVKDTIEMVNDEVKFLAEKYAKARNFLYIGRKYNLPIAYEGALKLKELSYVHAEGYGAGEMKHGPLAMIDQNFPSMCIVPKDSVYEKNISNMQELKARRGPLIAIATKGDKDILHTTRDVIYIPKTLEMLTPFLSVVPLQLFAYYSTVIRGFDVDKPRNLAKSVTVE